MGRSAGCGKGVVLKTGGLPTCMVEMVELVLSPFARYTCACRVCAPSVILSVSNSKTKGGTLLMARKRPSNSKTTLLSFGAFEVIRTSTLPETTAPSAGCVIRGRVYVLNCADEAAVAAVESDSSVSAKTATGKRRLQIKQTRRVVAKDLSRWSLIAASCQDRFSTKVELCGA